MAVSNSTGMEDSMGSVLSKQQRYVDLVARGCLCGTERIAACPIHVKPSDNRGIRAYFEAGMPEGFPMAATCSICRAPGLMYPSVPLDRGDVPAGHAPAPTLICPRCSGPAAEMRLRDEAEDFGYALNGRSVFGTAAGVAA